MSPESFLAIRFLAAPPARVHLVFSPCIFTENRNSKSKKHCKLNHERSELVLRICFSHLLLAPLGDFPQTLDVYLHAYSVVMRPSYQTETNN